MTETLTQVEAKYALQLMQQTTITDHEMQALAAMHKANLETNSVAAETQTELEKAKWDFAGKLLSALVTGTFAGLTAYESHKAGMRMLNDITEFEKTGNYNSSAGKSLVRKAFDWAFIIK